MNIPDDLSGGCRCGRIRYRINSPPRSLYACHCTDCQKQSSSAFGMSLIVDYSTLEFVTGEAEIKFWDTHVEDGSPKHCAFCKHCGTRLFHAGSDSIRISIKAGSLDDTRWLQPVAHIWLRSAQPWLSFDPDKTASFETGPDNDSVLTNLWQRQLQD